MSEVTDIFQPNMIALDLARMLTGERLGQGISRTVYEWLLIKDAVVKFEREGWHQNVIEWETWERIEHTELARWFAPCLDISPCGRVLIQGRTKPVPAAKYPEKVPSFFTDLKRENWGIYKGRPVCHDYGIHLMLENGMTKRERKARWWRA